MIELSNKLVELDNNVPISVDIDKMSINEIDFGDSWIIRLASA